VSLKPAPATFRTLELLNFLALHSAETFSTSDLARHLGQNRATCQTILMALESSDWVRRGTDKSYGLGPGAGLVGHAVLSCLPIVEESRDVLQSLYNDFHVELTVSILSGGHFLTVDRAGHDSDFLPSVPIGFISRHTPPFGLVFVAWDSAALERWLARSQPPLDDQAKERHRNAAEAVRRIGYTAILDDVVKQEVVQAIEGRSFASDSDTSLAFRGRLADVLVYENLVGEYFHALIPQSVTNIVVPIFGPGDRIVAMLAAIAYPNQLNMEATMVLIGRLLLAASQVSARLNGSSECNARAEIR
jgi:DNA-binding IclR family transcriptional regulator